MKFDSSIIWYLIPLAVWLFEIIGKNKKKRKLMPSPQKATVPQEEILVEGEVVPEIIKEEISVQEKIQEIARKTALKKEKTFLGENPYEGSVEYRNNKERIQKKQTQNLEKKELPQNDYSEIDWKKAVVFSEILQPRF